MTRFHYVLKMYSLFEVQLLTGKGGRTGLLEEKLNLHLDFLYNFYISTPLLKLKMTICMISNRYEKSNLYVELEVPTWHLFFLLLFRLIHNAIEATTQLHKL